MANVTKSFMESNTDAFLISISIILSTVELTTILLNATVIFISCKSRCVQRNERSIYLLSLAIADLMVGITSSPVLLDLWLPQKSWIKTFSVCLVEEIVVCIAVAASAMILVLISVIQYLAVKFPYHYRHYCSKKRLGVTATVCVWIIATAVVSPMFLFLIDSNKTPHVDYCHPSKLLGDNKYVFNCMAIGWFVLIMTSIVSLNSLTILQIKQRRSFKLSNTSSVCPSETSQRKISGIIMARNSIELENAQERPVIMSTIKEVSEHITENSDKKSKDEVNDCSTKQALNLSDVQVINTGDISLQKQTDKDMVGTTYKKDSLMNIRKGTKTSTAEGEESLESVLSAKRRNISVFFFSQFNHTVDKVEVQRKQSTKPYFILIVSIIAFVGFLTPTVILTLIESIDEDSVDFDIHTLRYVFFIGIVINSMLNPLIYTFRMTPYMTYMKKTIFRKS